MIWNSYDNPQFDTPAKLRDKQEAFSHNGQQIKMLPRRGTNHRRPLHFEKYAEQANRFINEVAEELRCPRNVAARVTRAVLHAFRDRIPPDDAIEFAQGLPMALKGVFIDQYDISSTPVNIRHRAQFVEYVYEKYGPGANRDFPSAMEMAEAIRGVFFVLTQNMDYGQVEQIKNLLNKDIAKLLGNYWPSHTPLDTYF